MDYSICFKNTVYICVAICLYSRIWREKSLKSTQQSISTFFWEQRLGPKMGLFSFISLRTLQNCLNLLQETCMTFINDVRTNKKSEKKKEEEICKKLSDEVSGSPPFISTAPWATTNVANNILWLLPHPKTSWFTAMRKSTLFLLTSFTESFWGYLDYSQVFAHIHKCEITKTKP